MKFLACVIAVLSATSAARADIPSTYDPDKCAALTWQEVTVQRALFETREHEALRDTAVYQAWFTAASEAGLMKNVPPGDGVSQRFKILIQRLTQLGAQLETSGRDVLSNTACTQVTEAAMQTRQQECQLGLSFEGWINLNPCFALPSIFHPAITQAADISDSPQ